MPLDDLPDRLPAWCLDHLGVAVRYAEVFAWLMAELAGVTVAPPLPNPRWVRWDHTDSGLWPAIDFLDNRDQSVVPVHVAAAAERARGRLLAAALPSVLGHADFEAQNIRWHGREVGTVHDQARAHARAHRKLRGVPGGLSGRSGALVHGGGAGGRVGGQRVDGCVQRPGASTVRRSPAVQRCAQGPGSRTPPPG